MSWIEKLYRTYENNHARIGSPNDTIPLLPTCHTTQNAHVQVVLNGSGQFLRANVVPKESARTIIPATEESAGRTSGPVPHPLCDKLQYVAGDYTQYGGKKTAEFMQYLKSLELWCASPYAHPKVQAVLAYVRKGRLIQDLVNARVLHCDNKSSLLDSWPDKNQDAPEIFKVVQGQSGQFDVFIRFSIENPGDTQADIWTDRTVWQSWIDYYSSKRTQTGLCLVTGENLVLADQHPAKIRNSGDKAKLISSNDASGYTFRGRFTAANEACGVGFEITQQAHNALRWLIARQGYRDGDHAIVAWAVSGVAIPDPLADTLALLLDDVNDVPEQESGYTAQEIGIRLAKRMAGYAVELKDTDEVVVIGLDSATPGRMAITFYRELTGSELLQRVQAWHAGCCWLQRLGKERIFVGAPAPRDIAETAYGKRLDANLRKAAVQRLLPCIIDGSPLPRDLVVSCVRRASNKHGLECWEWEKALGIACALYRYHQKERRYAMSLERDRTTRDYLYGRLLALAEHLESRALYVAGEKRETNAGKLMQRFAERPYSTWRNIETGLTPYKVRLRTARAAFLHRMEMEIDEITAAFAANDFISDQQLTGEFLLGYHCQRAALRSTPVQNDLESEERIDE